MTRVQLRRIMRRRRRSLPKTKRLRCAVRLARRVRGLSAFRNSQRVAVYLSNDGELDLTLLIQRAVHAGKRCYVPVLCPLGGRRLWFALYHPGESLRKNRLHILEPKRSVLHRVRAWCLDLVLTPLVAFDAVGNRLGMGGGYYDQTLAFLTRRRAWHKPKIIGVAYDFQRVAALQPQSWDVALDAIVTEKRTYRRL